MRPLGPGFNSYRWAHSAADLARVAGLDPVQIVRFDGNVPGQPRPTARPGTIAGALAQVNMYAHGGYPELVAAIAEYVEATSENVVLGAGADDLIMLCARAYAGPGDRVSIVDEPTYPLYRIAAGAAGAEVGGGEVVLTYQCRPNNPTGALDEISSARPLVVDEAYHEYCGDTAVGLIADSVIVVRTFSKAFGLAGARVGYAIADADIAEELRRRQDPLPLSTLSAALALAALAEPPDVGPELAEVERCALVIRSLGLEPLPSAANFLFVPCDDADALYQSMLRDGVVVRAFADGFRFSVRDPEDDDLLLESLARALDAQAPTSSGPRRRVRHVRTTGETRVRVRLSLDGESRVRVATGSGIYDHLLEQLAFHGGLDLVLEAVGDLETGPHHTAEDAALTLGEALDKALGDRCGIARYGDAVVVMDDALAKAAVDLGGRPWCEVRLEHDPGLVRHVFRSFAQAGRLGLHIEARGTDVHHTAEAAFKAVGRALRDAVRLGTAGLPSTKGRI